MDKRLELTFTKGDVKMANKPMKRCSTSLDNRETQIKTPLVLPNIKEFIQLFLNFSNNIEEETQAHSIIPVLL